MAGRKKDPVWLHFDETKEGKWLRAKCKSCGKELSAIVARMKIHWDQCATFSSQDLLPGKIVLVNIEIKMPV